MVVGWRRRRGARGCGWPDVESWRALYGLNPMAGVVEGFRWALLGKAEGPGALLVVLVTIIILILVSGVYYFRRVEKTFADVV